MTQQTIERQDESTRTFIESKITETENSFRELLNQVKLRTKTKRDVMNAIEKLLSDFPLAVPLVCEMARAQFPNDVLITNEYLIAQTINSYNVRVASGDRAAIGEKSNYLFSIGRKEQKEEKEIEAEDGEQ